MNKNEKYPVTPMQHEGVDNEKLVEKAGAARGNAEEDEREQEKPDMTSSMDEEAEVESH